MKLLKIFYFYKVHSFDYYVCGIKKFISFRFDKKLTIITVNRPLTIVPWRSITIEFKPFRIY